MLNVECEIIIWLSSIHDFCIHMMFIFFSKSYFRHDIIVFVDFSTNVLQEFDFSSNCIIYEMIKLWFFFDLISIARKFSQFQLFDACASSQFAHFEDIWEHDLIDLHIKHRCILVSWFFAQCLHFAVSLHVLFKCSNF